MINDFLSVISLDVRVLMYNLDPMEAWSDGDVAGSLKTYLDEIYYYPIDEDHFVATDYLELVSFGADDVSIAMVRHGSATLMIEMMDVPISDLVDHLEDVSTTDRPADVRVDNWVGDQSPDESQEEAAV